ncbi:NUC188 domain-domain-containing protein [Syncephalastrum racemosum]|uniref:NUC188 domain-domain-containing protein n=1 Tax=Syncephalastrum racemosum TaxID=13706 RepID=A0A1X2H6E9_SYNRA|nr:NUC188 domain-domain-containing protein [Syncephalastrum racemosum]
MGEKRPNEKGDLTGKAKRRAKNDSRRVINVDRMSNELKTSKMAIGGSIRVPDFAAARVSEIAAMQKSIRDSVKTSNSLSFQCLPRHLRRRAASFKLNRLPARLRARGAHEREKNPPKITKKIKGKRKPTRSNTLVEEYLRRSKTNKWLETHIWHTKRFKMEDIWGYRLAKHNNMKMARVYWRAFQRSCVVHDASYMGCVELVGPFDAIVNLMSSVTDIAYPSVSSARFCKGKAMGHTYLYGYMACPTQPIAPIQYIWQPSDTPDQRRLWLWLHPSVFEQGFETLKTAHKELSSSSSALQLNDLRDEICQFQLSGRKSTSILSAVLQPVDTTDDDPRTRIWQLARQLDSSSSLPPGAALGLTVEDPRLKFPQKARPSQGMAPQDKKALEEALLAWPPNLAHSGLWEAAAREDVRTHRTPQSAIAKRRSETLLPGTKLSMESNDNRVPILLVQRGMADGPRHSTTSQSLTSHAELQEGWTLLVPRGWGNTFWISLVFAGALPMGYQDMQALHYEVGQPSYPLDHVGTPAYTIEQSKLKEARASKWHRRPPAKRVNYGKLGIAHPFEPHFEDVVQQGPLAVVRGDGPVTALLKAATDAEASMALTAHYTAALAKRKLTLTPTLSVDQVLLHVRVSMLGGGKPQPNAMVYLISDRAEYELTVKRRTKYDTEQPNLTFPPPEDDRIGYLTTAGFSLTAGHGLGLGACSAIGIRRMQAYDEKDHRSIKNVVWVRNLQANQCYAAKLELLG